jgi:large subunit ribosomal protein L18
MNLKEKIMPKIRLQTRQLRISKKIYGTKDKPRVSVYRSLKHIYAQAIDDESSTTLAACSTLCKDIRNNLKEKKKSEQSFLVGMHLAEKLKSIGIKKVVFDRNGRKYIGRIQKLAEGLRKGGIEF